MVCVLTNIEGNTINKEYSPSREKQPAMPATMKAEAFTERLKLNETRYILDVRTDMEFKKHRLKSGYLHVPLDQLTTDRAAEMMPDKTRPVYVVCNSGRRSLRAAALLRAQGYEKVFSVDGGLSACSACGLKAKGNVALLCVIAVIILALGFVFGAYVHPVFYVMGGLLGASLMVRAMTGRFSASKLWSELFACKDRQNEENPPTCCALKKPEI